jgi:hypothetical protein
MGTITNNWGECTKEDQDKY